MAGVKEVFFANWAEVASGVTEDGTTGEIDALPEFTLYRYECVRNSGSCDTTMNQNVDNSSLFYSQVVTLRLPVLSAAKKKELELLAKAKLVVFVRQYNDQILMVGRTDGAYVTSLLANTGKAKGDFTGYEITIEAQEPAQPFVLEAYTSVPFDNFVDVTLSPDYTVTS
jgi:hypothetical protein